MNDKQANSYVMIRIHLNKQLAQCKRKNRLVNILEVLLQ